MNIKDNTPKSDVGREYYLQNMSKEVRGGGWLCSLAFSLLFFFLSWGWRAVITEAAPGLSCRHRMHEKPSYEDVSWL